MIAIWMGFSIFEDLFTIFEAYFYYFSIWLFVTLFVFLPAFLGRERKIFVPILLSSIFLMFCALGLYIETK